MSIGLHCQPAGDGTVIQVSRIPVRHTSSTRRPVFWGLPIEILLEFILSGFFDVLLELLSHGFGSSKDARGRSHPVIGAVALLLLGGAAGGLTSWVLPTRLLSRPTVPGASMVVSPLLNGALMHYYGSWQARHHGRSSAIANFWGGALFALGFAVVRFLTVVEA